MIYSFISCFIYLFIYILIIIFLVSLILVHLATLREQLITYHHESARWVQACGCGAMIGIASCRQITISQVVAQHRLSQNWYYIRISN